MKKLRALKIRIYPNKTQERQLLNTFGACRFIYNQMLNERKEIYEQLKENKRELYEHKYKTEKEYKQEFEWMKEVDSMALQQSRMGLVAAYSNFFKRLKKKVKKEELGFPKFKNKHSKQSYRTVQAIKIDFENKKIKLPKITQISFRDPRIINGIDIRSATISRTKTGKYFVSLLYYKEFNPKIIDLKAKDLKIKGLDASLCNYYVDEQGNSPEYERWYRKYESKLAYLQSIISKRQKGSGRRSRTQLKVNLLQEKISNSRKDFIEKLSLKLIQENDVIVVEDLNLKAMSQSLKLGKSVHDLGYSTFVIRLKNKAEEQGKIVIEADRWFASSKTCNHCGYIKHDLTLSEREWKCPQCNREHHRDINASQNLVNYGNRVLQELQSKRVEVSPCELPSVNGIHL